MADLVPVRRALLSVSDKSDLAPFARALHELGVELISTGGTATALRQAGLPVRTVDELTAFPEMLDGRVKTLHPKVHGGLLARRGVPEHERAVREHGIELIDLVCVNLYPFEQTVRRADIADEECIEQIDIGGPSMLRSAAKNHESVCVLTSPGQYDQFITELRANKGSTTFALRRRLAAAAFAQTSAYDAAISTWFDRASHHEFPATLRLGYSAAGELRYGENPHQRAALYRELGSPETGVVAAPLLAGKPLSYNNILDASAALECAQDLNDLRTGSGAACVIVKHTNPCGAALGAHAVAAFEAAYAGDPLAAYGGIVAISVTLDADAARTIATGNRFLEVVLAPQFAPEAAEILAERWKNVRLIASGPLAHGVDRPMSVRSIPGGMLMQERDTRPIKASEFVHVAGPASDAAMLADAALAMTVAKHLKSNAVCIVGGGSLWGAGAGQMDRVASCRLAVEKAGSHLRAATLAPVAASDAFFPFPDGPRVLIDAGVRCIVHPGGSKRDDQTTQLCQERGVTCLISGARHFRH